MDIQPNVENYEWSSDTMWPEITGLPVYNIMHIKDGFINQSTPLLSVKRHPISDERDIDDFVWVTVEENPIDLSNSLDSTIFNNITQFIRKNLTSLNDFWNNGGNIGSIRDLVEPVN